MSVLREYYFVDQVPYRLTFHFGEKMKPESFSDDLYIEFVHEKMQEVTRIGMSAKLKALRSPV